jgi:hypothetical protein
VPKISGFPETASSSSIKMGYPDTTTGFAVKDFQSWNSFTKMEVSVRFARNENPTEI